MPLQELLEGNPSTATKTCLSFSSFLILETDNSYTFKFTAAAPPEVSSASSVWYLIFKSTVVWSVVVTKVKVWSDPVFALWAVPVTVLIPASRVGVTSKSSTSVAFE